MSQKIVKCFRKNQLWAKALILLDYFIYRFFRKKASSTMAPGWKSPLASEQLGLSAPFREVSWTDLKDQNNSKDVETKILEEDVYPLA